MEKDGIILQKKIYISALLRGITSKHHGDFYCLNCLHSFASENKCEPHKKLWKCNIVVPSEDTKILELKQHQKSDEVLFVIYANLEYLTENTDGCKNNPENSSTTKVGEHIP